MMGNSPAHMQTSGLKIFVRECESEGTPVQHLFAYSLFCWLKTSHSHRSTFTGRIEILLPAIKCVSKKSPEPLLFAFTMVKNPSGALGETRKILFHL